MTPYIELITHCPHCGSKYASKQADKSESLKCSSCNFRNFVKSFPAVTAIIPNAVNPMQIFVTRRAIEPGLGKLDCPGGFVDYGETPDNALLRELKEELGIDAQIQKVLLAGKTDYAMNDIVYPTVVTCYLTAPVKLEDIDLDLSENQNIVVMDIEDLTSERKA